MRRVLVIPILAVTVLVSTSALSGERLTKHTRRDLLYAMKDEAFTYLKYKMFAEQAREKGKPVLADLFEQIAETEFQRHFKAEAHDFGLVKSANENLTNAVSDEYLESVKMYREMAKRAAKAGDRTVSERFAALASDEAEHHKAFKVMVTKRNAEASN